MPNATVQLLSRDLDDIAKEYKLPLRLATEQIEPDTRGQEGYAWMTCNFGERSFHIGYRQLQRGQELAYNLTKGAIERKGRYSFTNTRQGMENILQDVLAEFLQIDAAEFLLDTPSGSPVITPELDVKFAPNCLEVTLGLLRSTPKLREVSTIEVMENPAGLLLQQQLLQLWNKLEIRVAVLETIGPLLRAHLEKSGHEADYRSGIVTSGVVVIDLTQYAVEKPDYGITAALITKYGSSREMTGQEKAVVDSLALWQPPQQGVDRAEAAPEPMVHDLDLI